MWLYVSPGSVDDCWVWTGGLSKAGYGISQLNKVRIYAHRMVYEYLVALVPEALVLDHLCRNRACVNPWYLDPVTNEENLLRGDKPWSNRPRKTHCKHGHEFTVENTGRDKKGHRFCRTCGRLNLRLSRARRNTKVTKNTHEIKEPK